MPTEILQKFTTNLRQSLKNSFKIAIDLKHPEVTPLHLLYGLTTQKGSIAAEILAKAGLNKDKIIPALLVFKKEENGQACLPDRQACLRRQALPILNEEVQKILEKAAVMAFKNNHRYIGTEHLLCAFSQMKIPSFLALLEEQKINIGNLKQNALGVLQSANRFPEIASLLGLSAQAGLPFSGQGEQAKLNETAAPRHGGVKKTPALDFFTFDLTSAKAQKQMDPIVGRGQEIQRLIQILSRRLKNNPVLLGDPGVGKTAIVEGLAQKISSGEVPDDLQGKKILRVDLGLMVAGTIYRGEFEGRLKQLLEEVKSNPDIILFIDELHTIVGAGAAGGTLDAANMLKPALARGELRCIGATTFEEYKKHIESDAALERRFQAVLVKEPTREETIAILRGIRPNYEKHHGIQISDEAIEAAVDLSLRYRQDKFLPDKAIDLLDESAAAKKLTLKSSGFRRRLKALEKKLQEWQEEKQQAVETENFEKAAQLKAEEEKLIQEIQELEKKSAKKRPRRPTEILTATDLAKMVAEATGLPTADLLDQDKNQLLNLEQEIKKRIVGQDEAVAAVARALQRARLGLSDPNRPLASFLFAGPSGAGKTELAKVLAEVIFKDQAAFIRLDMSEFSEGFQVSKLIGSPAGYVGYKEGNKFTDQVKTHPYSVILFDEIDKAHPEVFNIFLQILDEGHLTDAVGKKINFKNTIIIMTTNLGNEYFSPAHFGFEDGQKKKQLEHKDFESIKNSVLKELKNRFRLEFLNRLDSILFFKPLALPDLEKIVDLQIEKINQRLAKKSLKLTLASTAREMLAQKAQALDQGARAIAKVIQNEIEEPLTNILLTSEIRDREIKIEMEKGKIQISNF